MAGQFPFRLPPTEPIFVGFAGRMGAGKTSAARYLSSKYGLQYRRYSQVLQEWFSADAADRARLQKIGWDIMAGGLQEELNSRLIAGLDHSRGAVIDGLRHRIDFDRLATAFGDSFRLIFLEAPQDYRFGRLRSRFSTIDEFQAADSHPVEANIDTLRLVASLIIPGDEPLESLYQRLDAWIDACAFGDHK